MGRPVDETSKTSTPSTTSTTSTSTRASTTSTTSASSTSEIKLERQYDNTLLDQTNFWFTGSLFFLSRFLYPIARLMLVPSAAIDAPAIFVFAFLVPTLGLLTMMVQRKLHLLLVVGGLDVVHWVLSALPMHHDAYWTQSDDLWEYPLNLLAFGQILMTIVFVLTYGRNIAAERYRPKSEPRQRKGKTSRPKKTRVQFAGDLGSADETEDGNSYRSKGKKKQYQRSTGCDFSFGDSDRKDREASWKENLPKGMSLDGVPQPKTPGKRKVEKIINALREELLGIGSIQKRKVRLRELQKQYHPDKNPPKDEETVREVFYYVQKWWDDIDGIQGVYEGEFRAHLEV